MRECKCPCTIVYGPGDDDYGRDKLMEDWECPSCHKKSQHSRLDIRLGVSHCPNCDWVSDEVRKMRELISKIRIDKDGKVK